MNPISRMLARKRQRRERHRRETRRAAERERYAGAGWRTLLDEVQAEIASYPDTNPHYHEAYRDAEQDYWLHVPGWICERIEAKAAEGCRSLNCLDIGCAYGTLARFAQRAGRASVWCIDFVDNYLSKQLVEENGWRFEVCNIELEELPWPREEFDIILFTEVLEHFNFEPVETLKKISRHLRPDGRIFLTTPDASEWGRVTHYYPSLDAIPRAVEGLPVVDDHVWQYSLDELEGVIDRAGLEIVRRAFAPGTPNRHFNLELTRRS